MKVNPTIQTLNTNFSRGRLNHVQTISLEDTAKFHGHLCDGLVIGFLGLREALYRLYPDKIIDRTNIRLVSKSSPCIADIGIYLTGGRYQFNSSYVDDQIQYSYIIQRIDDGQNLAVKLKSGIKPLVIQEMDNHAVTGKLSPCDLDHLKDMEDDFAEKLLSLDPKDLFEIQEIKDFKWVPVLENNFINTDLAYKNMPLCNH
jgi:formylmethanofuran dehydrogenase subunit E